MDFQTIQPLRPIGPEEWFHDTGSTGAPERQPTLFADIFQSAIDSVKETDAEKNHTEYLLATGQLDNPMELMIDINQASASANLLVQLRNKALDAYSELMRISL